jgi:predicted membrane channel-forming protein YqfA (hemolysin III family)
MTSNVRTLFWIEVAVASLCGFLAVLTIFSRDWIEALTGYDLDQHDGSVEWMMVVGLALVCILLSLAARTEWRRSRATTAANI